MKRWFGIPVVVVTVAMVVATLPNSARATTPAPLSASDQAFQGQVTAYLQNLQGALNAAAQNPATKAAIAPKLQDEQTALNVGLQQVPNLTGTQLEAMQAIVGTNSNWAQEPATVQQRLAAVTAPAPAPKDVTGGALSDCTSGFGNIQADFYASWAAAQVASAANAVASGMPDGADFAPALIVAGVAYGVAAEISVVTGGLLANDQDCATAASNASLESQFPTDASVTSNPDNYAEAANQDDVTTLKSLADGIDTTIASIQSTTSSITNKLNTLSTSLGTAQGTANGIDNIATDLQSRTDSLLSTVGGANDGTPNGGTTSDSANGLANAINANEDTILSNISTFQNLSVRLEIERSLAEYSQSAQVGLFQLPATQGGYLERARDLTSGAITAMTAAGQTVNPAAQMYLSQGNAYYANGQWTAAFARYALAYQLAVN